MLVHLLVNLNRSYKLYTDVGDYCVGTVLCQDDTHERVIQYFSHQLASTQCTWPTIVKESFAIVYAIDRLRVYLQGAKLSLYTDHCPLTSLFTRQIKNTKLIRLRVFLAEFDADVMYIQGSKNNVAIVSLPQVEPLPCVPAPWLPIDTYDMIQFIHPDALIGQTSKGHILLEADELNADQVCLYVLNSHGRRI